MRKPSAFPPGGAVEAGWGDWRAERGIFESQAWLAPSSLLWRAALGRMLGRDVPANQAGKDVHLPSPALGNGQEGFWMEWTHGQAGSGTWPEAAFPLGMASCQPQVMGLPANTWSTGARCWGTRGNWVYWGEPSTRPMRGGRAWSPTAMRALLRGASLFKKTAISPNFSNV